MGWGYRHTVTQQTATRKTRSLCMLWRQGTGRGKSKCTASQQAHYEQNEKERREIWTEASEGIQRGTKSTRDASSNRRDHLQHVRFFFPSPAFIFASFSASWTRGSSRWSWTATGSSSSFDPGIEQEKRCYIKTKKGGSEVFLMVLIVLYFSPLMLLTLSPHLPLSFPFYLNHTSNDFEERGKFGRQRSDAWCLLISL